MLLRQWRQRRGLSQLQLGVQADVTVECSGSPRGLGSAIRGTARGGRVVMVGLLPSGDQPVPVSLAISRELELVGSFRFNDEIDQVIVALADLSLEVAPVVTHEFPVAEAIEAFTAIADANGWGFGEAFERATELLQKHHSTKRK